MLHIHISFPFAQPTEFITALKVYAIEKENEGLRHITDPLTEQQKRAECAGQNSNEVEYVILNNFTFKDFMYYTMNIQFTTIVDFFIPKLSFIPPSEMLCIFLESFNGSVPEENT